MADLKFDDAEYPSADKVRVPNQYAPMVQEMIDTNKSKSVTMSNKTAEDKANITSLISSVQAAGRDLGVTVNKRIEELTGKDAGKSKIYFKVRAAIRRSAIATSK